MDWIHFFESLTMNDDRKFGFTIPASEDRLNVLQEQLGLAQLPPELDELYKQTNGVQDCLFIESINELIVSGWLIWDLDRVLDTNTFHRNSDRYKKIYKSFDNLLFFSDAGNGDLFAFETLKGKIEGPDVYVWNHEDDSREWVAPSMKDFAEGWASGAIKI